jgi:hypothetical protein
MSLLASGRHYIRDGTGAERLYDLKNDPFERADLAGSPDGLRTVADLRKMLLGILSEDRGTTEVEAAYLESFRRGLQDHVREAASPRIAAGP